MTDHSPPAPGAEDPAPSYLEAAAAEALNVREYNEERREHAASVRDADPAGAREIDAETAARSLEIAEIYARLAAIEAGLPPCCGHHARPEPEREPS